MEEKIIELLKTENRGFDITEIEDYLGIKDALGLAEVLKCLHSLEESATVYQSKSKKYMLLVNSHLKTGRFIGNRKGFGFVVIQGEEDIFVAKNNVNGAIDGDTVILEIFKKGMKPEGRILSIVNRANKLFVGEYYYKDKKGHIIFDDNKISIDVIIEPSKSMNAMDGHKVLIKLGKKLKANTYEGEVVKIIGHKNDPGVDILSIVKGFDLPTEFPERVLNQAERVAKEVSEADRAGRKDLRQLMTVTIDGEDAKDLDDAISLSYEEGKYHLGVHIADVSNYVQENSALDREALERGTSVYLVDRVIPMLPHVLSNGMCSLNMGEDRLALSCLMTVDQKGNVIDHEIVESVIHVDERMNYTDVNRILEENDPALCRRYEAQVSMFHCMKELADILREKRKSRGSIDFDFPESKIELDKEGNPISIKPYERRIANKIIEDFMLLANETVAQHFYWMEIPFVYRTHETPDPEKIMKLGTFIRNFGYNIKVKTGDNEIHPKEIQKLLGKIEGTPEEALLSRLTLRSMKRASYQTECMGHFGLACPYYCHFTSPIRRYPDLQIHRIIKEQLRGRMDGKRILHYEEILPEVAKHSSRMERRADEAERETEKLKKAQYMVSRIGEKFEGVISGVTAWGIYVELPNTVEGMVHVSRMAGDYYYYDEQAYEMIGRDTGRTFRLGQKVDVIVDDVDLQMKSVDFVLQKE